jgi:hypothetical protein
VTLVLGTPATCTITNDDITPTLTVVKTVINNNGGTITDPDLFGLKVDGGGVLHNATNNFDAGPHTVSEDGQNGYQPGTWGGDCATDGSITLQLNQDATCTITNNDISPTITVINTVINNNGGMVIDPDAFGLRVDDGSVLDSITNAYDVGAHVVSADGLTGYQASTWGGDCAVDGSVMLTLDQDAVCTITHNDISPTITVVKTIINDNGGAIFDEDAFGLKVDGTIVLHNETNDFDTGVHTLSEDGLFGYQGGTWGGDCEVDGTVTLVLDQDATCTIINNDISPTLTIIKSIVNDNGGQITDPDVFGLRVDGISVLNNVIIPLNVGLHIATEDGLVGYLPGLWGGDCATNGTITRALSENAVCTISNNDISPTLTVVKTIVNDNGGPVTDEDTFGLRVDGAIVLNAVSNTYDAGNHSVSEDGLPEYLPGSWGGDCDAAGNVTLALAQDATCTISNDDISPTLTIIKTIINNNGGLVTDPNAFGLRVDGISVLHSIATAFDVGSHIVSEDGLAGYQPGSWGGDCDAAGNITLSLNEDAICTITNNDISPTLTVFKSIVNDNGGVVMDENIFALKVDGDPVLHNAVNDFDAGDHVVSEDGLLTYQPGAWGGDCDADGNVTLVLGEPSVCTITNDDIAPTLTIIKTIINDNGGLVNDPNAFGLRVDGGSVLNNASNSFNVGDHIVSEDGLAGYQPGVWGGDCDVNGNITLALNQVATCTITNNDISPTLTVIKTIVNDNGGTVMDADAFALKVNGGAVLNNVTNNFDAGQHNVSEDGLPGYQPGAWGGDCNPDGSITLVLDQDAVCTITNDDITPTLTVVKTIINNNGGTEANPNVFGLLVDGGSVLHNVANNFDAGNHAASEEGLAGYQPSVWGGDCSPDGSITLVLDQDAVCTITNDDSNSTSLTLITQVVNDNGGGATGSEWTLIATGPTGFSGSGPNVSNAPDFFAGTYDLSESGPAGYIGGAWVCVGGTQVDFDTITLALGEAATCTITNDDISPTLTVFKTIINDHGGTITNLNAFGLRVNDAVVPHNVSNEYDAGEHMVSEDGLPGYVPGDWGGDCNPDGSITLALDQDAVCTITNDDSDSTGLTLVEQVINDNGGSATAAEWTLTATGPTGFSGAGPNVSNAPDFFAGTYDLSESGPVGIINDNGGKFTDPDDFGLRVDGNIVLNDVTNTYDVGEHTVSEDGNVRYTPGVWGGHCDADGNISLVLAQVATCTITNNDINFGEVIFKDSFE